ncbi:MAG: divalent-cation tolerance protein CutA [Candidatus Kerfeldbacteria bacterium]|nr:divalent-cation tolerance protein CutA [Candidatus Kerfeldbacteria bacterium]
MIHVYIHYPSRAEARRISKLILQRRLAACINFIKQEDLYWWRGKLVASTGVITLIATQPRHYKKIERLVLAHHSYAIPCILRLPVSHALPAYHRWLLAETTLTDSK